MPVPVCPKQVKIFRSTNEYDDEFEPDDDQFPQSKPLCRLRLHISIDDRSGAAHARQSSYKSLLSHAKKNRYFVTIKSLSVDSKIVKLKCSRSTINQLNNFYISLMAISYRQSVNCEYRSKCPGRMKRRQNSFTNVMHMFASFSCFMLTVLSQIWQFAKLSSATRDRFLQKRGREVNFC